MELTNNFVGESTDTASTSSNQIFEDKLKQDIKKTDENLLENTNGDNKRTVVDNYEGIATGSVIKDPESKTFNENIYTRQHGSLLKISGQDWKNSFLFNKVLPTRCSSSMNSEPSNVRFLPREDFILYGEVPKLENKGLVECKACELVLLPSAFKVHFNECKVSTSSLESTKKYLKENQIRKTIPAKSLPPVPLFSEKAIPLQTLEELVSSREVLVNLSNLKNQRKSKENGLEGDDNYIKTRSGKWKEHIHIQRPIEGERYHKTKTTETEIDCEKSNLACNTDVLNHSKESPEKITIEKVNKTLEEIMSNLSKSINPKPALHNKKFVLNLNQIEVSSKLDTIQRNTNKKKELHRKRGENGSTHNQESSVNLRYEPKMASSSPKRSYLNDLMLENDDYAKNVSPKYKCSTNDGKREVVNVIMNLSFKNEKFAGRTSTQKLYSQIPNSWKNIKKNYTFGKHPLKSEKLFVQCNKCEKMLSPAAFELHVGYSKQCIEENIPESENAVTRKTTTEILPLSIFSKKILPALISNATQEILESENSEILNLIADQDIMNRENSTSEDSNSVIYQIRNILGLQTTGTPSSVMYATVSPLKTIITNVPLQTIQVLSAVSARNHYSNLRAIAPKMSLNNNSMKTPNLMKPLILDPQGGHCIINKNNSNLRSTANNFHHPNILRSSARANISKINIKRTSNEILIMGSTKYVKLNNAFRLHTEDSDSVDTMVNNIPIPDKITILNKN